MCAGEIVEEAGPGSPREKMGSRRLDNGRRGGADSCSVPDGRGSGAGARWRTANTRWTGAEVLAGLAGDPRYLTHDCRPDAAARGPCQGGSGPEQKSHWVDTFLPSVIKSGRCTVGPVAPRARPAGYRARPVVAGPRRVARRGQPTAGRALRVARAGRQHGGAERTLCAANGWSDSEESSWHTRCVSSNAEQ